MTGSKVLKNMALLLAVQGCAVQTMARCLRTRDMAMLNVLMVERHQNSKARRERGWIEDQLDQWRHIGWRMDMVQTGLELLIGRVEELEEISHERENAMREVKQMERELKAWEELMLTAYWWIKRGT